jgi:hypothetical protein
MDSQTTLEDICRGKRATSPPRPGGSTQICDSLTHLVNRSCHQGAG